MKIYISGQWELSSLDEWTMKKLDSLMKKKFLVLIGDRTETDKLIQSYLFLHNYKYIIVYCDGKPVINVGNFPTISYMSTKLEQLMIESSDYSLIIGSDVNEFKYRVENILRHQKYCSVHMPGTNNYAIIRAQTEYAA